MNLRSIGLLISLKTSALDLAKENGRALGTVIFDIRWRTRRAVECVRFIHRRVKMSAFELGYAFDPEDDTWT